MKYYFLGLALCLFYQIHAQTHPELPKPIGSYGISTIKNIELSDTTRIERAISGHEEFRKLNFDLFYPTDNSSLVKVPYWENPKLYADVLDSLQFKIVNQGIKTNSAYLGRISTRNQKYPLIIFSPGWQATRLEFTILVEHLASMGNIVAILDHPFMGYANRNGALTPPTDQGFKSYEDFRDYLGADQLWVLHYLWKQNNSVNSILSGRINTKKIVSIGQSAGFLSTKGAALMDVRITKCVSLDAKLGNKEELKNLKQDVLLLALERAVLHEDFNFKENVVELAYRNAGHFSIADWTFLKTSPREMEPNAGSTLLANYAANIDLFIKEDTLDSFVKKIEKYPNLDVTLHKAH
ncbi:hypothetical protein FGF1_08960 [Flavobacteriaceae bacterium GF1]